MLIKCKCGKVEEINLHKDGYEVIYGTCAWCMNWTRKFVVPGEVEKKPGPTLKSLKKNVG
jgi:hypothetical protein